MFIIISKIKYIKNANRKKNLITIKMKLKIKKV